MILLPPQQVHEYVTKNNTFARAVSRNADLSLNTLGEAHTEALSLGWLACVNAGAVLLGMTSEFMRGHIPKDRLLKMEAFAGRMAAVLWFEWWGRTMRGYNTEAWVLECARYTLKTLYKIGEDRCFYWGLEGAR